MLLFLRAAFVFAIVAASLDPAHAADLQERIERLEEALAAQSNALADRARLLEQQKRELEALKAAQRQSANGVQTPGNQAARRASAPTVSINAAPGRSYWIQIASATSNEKARQFARQQAKKNSDLIDGLSLVIEKADVRGHTYHRVQIGPLNQRSVAREHCEKFEQRGVDCLVLARGGDLKTAAVAPTIAPKVNAPTSPVNQPRPEGQVAQQPEGRSSATAQATPGKGAASATSAPTTDSEKPVRPQVDVEALTDRGGVLTPPGTIVVEPSIEYLHDSGNRVLIEGLSVLPAILIGTIDVRNVERDTLISSMTARAGIASRFDMDVKVPYVYRRDETTAREIGAMSNSDEVTSVSGHGLGDIEFGGHYQINDGVGGWPFFIGNLRVKTPTGRDPFEVPINDQGLQTELPTGTGFWGIEPSISFLLPSPPAVWFGNVKYLWNVERDIGGGFGTIDPGDAIGATVGVGFSINERTSLSLGADYQSVFETTQNGRKVSGSSLQIASGLLGMSYRLNENIQLNLSTQAGFTDDATDFRALFRVPITFNVSNNLIPEHQK